MVNVRQYLALYILLGIAILGLIGNIMIGDQSDAIPTVKYRWLYWEVDRTTAILFNFGQLVGGMAVIAIVFRKELKAIIGVGMLYAILGILTLSGYLSNHPNFNYLVWQDLAFLLFPALLVILKLTGRMRPLSERTEAEQQVILQRQDEIEQKLSQMRKEEARHWWLKWLPLLLVVAAIPTAWIGWMIVRNIRGLDEMYPIYAGFIMALAGIMLFKAKRTMKWSTQLGY